MDVFFCQKQQKCCESQSNGLHNGATDHKCNPIVKCQKYDHVTVCVCCGSCNFKDKSLVTQINIHPDTRHMPRDTWRYFSFRDTLNDVLHL